HPYGLPAPLPPRLRLVRLDALRVAGRVPQARLVIAHDGRLLEEAKGAPAPGALRGLHAVDAHTETRSPSARRRASMPAARAANLSADSASFLAPARNGVRSMASSALVSAFSALVRSSPTWPSSSCQLGLPERPAVRWRAIFRASSLFMPGSRISSKRSGCAFSRRCADQATVLDRSSTGHAF